MLLTMIINKIIIKSDIILLIIIIKTYEANMTLRELKTGQSATVTVVGGEGALRQHFLDMGIIPGTRVVLTKFAPMGDPMEIEIRGYELSLRKEEAERIEVEPE